MRDEYDVIVVGAGPGGSIAARTAAEECDVLLLEKRQEIGSPVRCAEGVKKAGLEKFIQPDEKWISGEPKCARIYSPDGTMVELSEELAGDEVGYVLERKLFDRELAKSAARAGAHVTVRTRATGLIMHDDTVQGVKINRLGEDFDIRAKVVIGADGVESKVGRWAGINTTLKLKDIGSCAQYHMANVDASEDYCDFYLGSPVQGGYAWVFPKGGRTANIGLGIVASRLNGKRPIDYLDEFASKVAPGGQPVELVVGAVPSSDDLKSTIANGLMLVGDAAHHCDPLTGGGVINAMEGGKIAGDVATKAVRQNDASTKVLAEYETTWRASFGEKLKRNYKVKEFFVNLPNEDFNKLARSIQGAKIEEMTSAGFLKHLLKANPKLLFSIRHLL
jgi:digeranylgeranylglycerophospholipid reductase